MASDPFAKRTALESAKLHLTGEERVAQDKANSSIGPVASRTREKCGVPNSLGITEPSQGSEYNEDGILTGRYVIKDIYWGEDSDMQCKVNINLHVHLSALLDFNHELALRRYYDDLMKKSRGDHAMLAQITNKPSPSDIIKFAQGYGFLRDATQTPRRISDTLGRWKMMMERWNLFIAKLEIKKASIDKSKASIEKAKTEKTKAQEAIKRMTTAKKAEAAKSRLLPRLSR
ncbi:hypothetical protein M426DRAFT_256113 [Hypoxylon sp. CI-4A]|nr:hypothetical protein M426DRAFT_256113 [Hypoxylon sp. CI-4A]